MGTSAGSRPFRHCIPSDFPFSSKPRHGNKIGREKKRPSVSVGGQWSPKSMAPNAPKRKTSDESSRLVPTWPQPRPTPEREKTGDGGGG